MKLIKYLLYLLKHKYYVMIECFKRGLYWRGLVHDNSKFLPSEFFPYMNYFFSKNNNIKRGRNKTGYYTPYNTGDNKFDFAFFLHQKRNKHHWQWWVLPKDENGTKTFEILEPYLTEMICDWIGAGKAQGKSSPKNDIYYETRQWYNNNKTKLQLHDNTRKKIEIILGVNNDK